MSDRAKVVTVYHGNGKDKDKYFIKLSDGSEISWDMWVKNGAKV